MGNEQPGSLLSLGVAELDMAPLMALAERASKAILEIYADESLWQQQAKSDDTPVTAADIKSSEILVAGLPSIVDCPVVSEEALPSYEQRKDWPLYWLIDPIDGTKEFINRTGEFVINVALMHNHQPVFGLIYQIVNGRAWWGGPSVGAYTNEPVRALEKQLPEAKKTLFALGSRRSEWRGGWRDRLDSEGIEVSVKPIGSALKFAYLADGSADFYPRLGLTSEWDTAAPQAILAATGGAIVQWNGQPIEYGKEDTLNPYFIAVREQSLLDYFVEQS
ncbi:3'(2'),5'-bisphosphate nucleotidase CysQ family protein [Reinekea thalattae]|uniref:3'(2'),5'-bisphosphate nucleotidase CysQ n=1 Tax=Reinekea thalattae TaxID=2593301 RepID=A0A5C8Z9S5_9GAMM|nr:3'(2'),5'-bisphosphate nucleotidase CysQ [Reinekea thalattae]TXR54845.1 3'(2'),5'-bisphosphate nucleotidase CysQ [Reinekea thalattae]